MPSANLLDPPGKGQRAQFAPGFGHKVLLTVDTEEEFDWNGPFRRDGWGLGHVHQLAKFQEFCDGLGVVPVYLVDWPIATSELAREILAPAVAQGRAEIGVQLHPWVNPPHDEDVSVANSFTGNLPPDLQREKFRRLRNEIEEAFATVPRIYRAGRYGLGPDTAAILKDGGIAIDSSVRANYDYSPGHGPDYSRHPLWPYWADETRSLLELPLTTVHWGPLRRQGRMLQPLMRKVPLFGGALARLGLLETIPLTPEGVTTEEALRGIDMAIDDGLPILVLSFHSPSLQPGHTPYVRNDDDLDRLYDWFRGVYSYFRLRNVEPTTVAEIIRSIVV